jgi:DNA invertase Pin-like site-specific DNA recombinase
MGQESAKKSPKIPVVEIIRVSTLAQGGDDKAGIPAQKAKCAAIAKRENLEPRWQKQIEGVSGAAILRSPEMQDVLRIIASGQCKGIVLSEESRLMRPDNYEDYSILQRLEERGVKLYLQDRVVDLSNPSDKLFMSMKMGFAGYERTLIRDRMVGGKRSKRDRGEWASGRNTVPYGLKVVKEERRNRLIVDETKIGRVVELFELFVSGVTHYGELHKRTGIPYDTIPYVLTNEIYTGWHVPKRTADPRLNEYWTEGERAGQLRYQRRVAIPEDERVRIRMLENPPIPESVFNVAQNLLKLKRDMHWKRGSANTPADPFAYRGFLRCSCGANISTVKYRNKGAKNFYAEYYHCRDAHDTRRPNGEIKTHTCKMLRMRREQVEAMLDELVQSKFGDKKLLQNLMRDHEQSANEETAKQKIGRLQAEIAEAERSIERNAEAYGRGSIKTFELFDRLQQKYELEKRAAEFALAAIRPNVEFISPKMWAPYALKFKRWHTLEQHEKRALLTAIAPTFEVSSTKGTKYHETVITIKGCRVNLTGEEITMEAQTAKEEREALVGIGSLSYSARNNNQPNIYIPF